MKLISTRNTIIKPFNQHKPERIIKHLVHPFLIGSLLLGVLPNIHAQDLSQQPITYDTQQTQNTNSSNDSSNGSSNDSQDKLVKYFKNFVQQLGYQPSQTPDASKISSALLSDNTVYSIQTFLSKSVLGATPVNAFSTALTIFIPLNAQDSLAINKYANATFFGQNFNSSGGAQNGKVSVNPLVDQQTYQNDPVSQAVLNILGTPDYTFCMSYDQSSWNSDCKFLYDNLVASNAIGNIPGPQEFFSYDYIEQFLPQLNSNTLLSPFLYSTQAPAATGSSSPPSRKGKGLEAQNQAQMAANFIRYATASLTPNPLPSQQKYGDLYNKATNSNKRTSEVDQKQAQATLSNYFASLRTYASQVSVGVGNMYFMLSKRLPQNHSANGSSSISSQAMEEFAMATWRLHNPSTTDKKNQWLNQINNASQATVQKEIAVLLAEINYQLYLNRQQDERMLLTNTIMLLQNAKTSQPGIESSEAE